MNVANMIGKKEVKTMVKQYDIIKLNFNTDETVEIGDYRPCLVVSDNVLTEGSGLAWVMPILTGKEASYPTDVVVESQEDIVRGVIDCVHIHSTNLKTHDYHTVDVLSERKIKEINDILSGVLNI